MKLLFLTALLFASIPLLAQEPVYKDFAVQQPAQPRGGTAYLETFLQANLRKPVPAQAAGIGGRVFMSGIVEPDGRLTSVTVVRGLRPDCDREAQRVFARFQAWSPALKDGIPVRQAVTYPVQFKPSAPFRYVGGARVDYYDASDKLLPDSSELARRKVVSPMDTNGLPTGHVVVYRLNGATWKEDYRLSFVRKTVVIQKKPRKTTRLLGYQTANQQWLEEQISLNDAGTITRQAYYQNGKRTNTERVYHDNGVMAQKTDEVADEIVRTAWYPNGQIRQRSSESTKNVLTADSAGRLQKTGSPVQVLAFWTSDGRPLVQEGNGQFMDQGLTASRSDTSRQTPFTETGLYKNGFKEGTWTIRYADGSYYCAEDYEDGFFKRGKACTAGADTLRYTTLEMMPTFQGGLKGLQAFLQQNLLYPPEAQRAGVQGQVVVSFVVSADGRVDDCEVMIPVHPDLDREALRVVRAMSGRWKAGIQRGQRVRVRYNVPINFALY